MKSKLVKTLFVGAAWAAVTAALSTGCLDRPVGQQPPTTKVNFTSTVSQQAVDKVDLLFAIDNSSSMGDKQDILKDAVPLLLTELIQPKCVSKTDGTTVITDSSGAIVRADPSGNKDNNYKCPDGSQPDFKPVTDMHIGIVSSSLGNFGAESVPNDAVCAFDAAHSRNNDHGLLVNYNGLNPTTGAENGPNPLANPDNFLSWLPQNDENVCADPTTCRHPPPSTFGGVAVQTLTDPTNGLTPNFENLVAGDDQTGCGLEAQLESVYRFLIQPDPWDTIVVDNFSQADLGDGISNDVLKQRSDFLRPDSLVAIIMLTDEDDSSADPLAVGGFGYAFMARNFPGSKVARGTSSQGTTAPRGTSVCATDPLSPDCTSCGFAANCDATQAQCQKIKSDPNCTTSGVPGQSGPGYDGFYGPTDDDLNVRFQVPMKPYYGVDPQYPLSRYVNGLTKTTVPNRKTEHTITTAASGQRQISDYIGTGACTNPLFASALPSSSSEEICALPHGTRTSDLVFFAIVGGVPQSLLHFTPGDTDASAITNDDWVKILGKDPLNFDYTGIDPHMVESIGPRANLLAGGDPNSPRGQNGTDPVQGREWNTKKTDRQYACTFPLPTPRDCSANSESCDCANDPNGGTPPNPPLCATDGSPTQIKAKAYPTVRELELAHALGDQGIVSSLCPIQLTDPTAPTYGYNPAVAVLVDRLKNALTTQCLPQVLRTPAEEAITPTPPDVPCLVLVQLSATSGQHCSTLNLAVPAPEILTTFKAQQKAESGNIADGGVDLSALEVCVLPQIDVAKGDTCADATDLEWCYVENDQSTKKLPAGRCPQALIFSGGTSTLAGARFSLQCIQQFTAGVAAGDGTDAGSH